MRTRLIALLLLLVGTCGCAESPRPEVLLVRSPDSGAGNWGALPALLGARVVVESRDDGVLPEGDLGRYKLIVLSTNLNVYEPQRQRLWEYVNVGGKLVTWFADDARADRIFWPYRLVLSDRDPSSVTFASGGHPLLKGLAGRKFEGSIQGGDVVKDWDREHWQVLADTTDGPAMLLASYGKGWILEVQFHVGLSARHEAMAPLASNLIDWAGLTPVSPADLAKRSREEVMLAVARRQLRTLQEGDWKRGAWAEVEQSRPPTGISWNYPWGVTLYGLLRVSAVTGDKTFAQFVTRHNLIAAKQHDYLQWQKATFGQAVRIGSLTEILRLSSLDDCGSMSSQVVEGMLNYGAPRTPETLAMMERVADYISHKQSRLPDGSLCRGSTLWIDDLYMSCPFLARWGTFTGESKYWDDAARQLLSFAGRLQDKDGLWFHGWFNREGKTNGYKWGRGNGWALLSEVEVLGQLPETHPDRARLLENLRRHIEGLEKVQAPSGLWRQVVDRPELWEETSCTGMYAYCIARACNRGWIGKEHLVYAQRAVEGLKAKVGWDGSVFDTCAGTGIGRSLEQYVARPRPVNDGHGPGPVLLAFSEVLAADGK